MKRLTVGGFDRVYEINRSFRNEGVSTKHNPEFTMLELYLAHETPDFLMTMIENMIRSISMYLFESHQIEYQAQTIDFADSFERLTMEEAVIKYNKETKMPFVEIETGDQEFEIREVELGLADGINVEVVSGISEKDKVKIWSVTKPNKINKWEK